MSLNGLDVADVQDAYQATVTEAGGWFLLKYVSRDQVELLGKGKQGVSEARHAITAYEDPSPLYGVIIYRRRKVLIKYIPANTSRLLQARTAVHFQDVVERFSPHETILQIATGEELNDTSLAASFPLHTATTSPSNTRLHEISEDAEDSGPAPRPPMKSGPPSSKYSAQRLKADRRSEQASRAEQPTPAIQVTSDVLNPSSEKLSSPTTPRKPSLSQFLVRDESGQTSITSLESPHSVASVAGSAASAASSKTEVSSGHASHVPRNGFSNGQLSPSTGKDAPLPSLPNQKQEGTSGTLDARERELPELPREKRIPQSSAPDGSASTYEKPSHDDDYDFSRFDELFKPKVKLAPRPVIAAEKPTTARVSGLPPNFRPKKQEPSRSSALAEQTTTSPIVAVASPSFPAPPPIPYVPEYQPRPVSRGSVKSLPSHKSTGLTADKIRLMKAVELRKKQMRKSNPPEQFKPPLEEDTPAVPSLPDTPGGSNPPEALATQSSEPSAATPTDPGVSDVPARSSMQEMKKGGLDPVVTDLIESAQSYKADSGIEMQYQKPAKKAESTADPDKPETSVDNTGVGATSEHVKREVGVVSGAAQQGNRAAPQSRIDTRAPDGARNVEPDQAEDTPVDAEHTPTMTTSKVEDMFLAWDKPKPEAIAAERAEVPTIVMADGSRPKTSDTKSAEDEGNTLDLGEDRTLNETSEENDMEREASMGQSPKQQNLAKRRRGFVEPLQVPAASSGNPDDFGSDDEEFFEELQSATVHEAKPMTMSKSPTFTEFPRRPSSTSDAGRSETDMSIRSISISKAASPVDRTTETLEFLSPEATKIPLTYTPTGAIPADRLESLSSYNRNVSSGISRRIQALAERSNRDSVTSSLNNSSRPLTPEATPTPVLQHDRRERKASMRGLHGRPTSYRRNSHRVSAMQPANMTPSLENAPVLSFQHDPVTNRNSVSVTARIVRPATLEEIETSEPQLDPDLHLNQSHDQTASNGPQPLDTEEAPARAASVHSVNSLPGISPARSRNSNERALHSASRFGRHKQMTSSNPAADDSVPTSASGDTTPTVDESTPGPGSRTSRFFKRMSTLSNAATGMRRGSQKKSVDSSHENQGMASRIWNRASGSVQADKLFDKSASAEHVDMPPACVVGDLNIQFPEALLWKRRIVTIDDSGHLQFSIAQAMEIHKGVAIRRHHISEFKQPYLPDAEQQELPHSVFLEFSTGAAPELVGTTIQAACEDSLTHRAVMHLLRSYWKAWAATA